MATEVGGSANGGAQHSLVTSVATDSPAFDGFDDGGATHGSLISTCFFASPAFSWNGTSVLRPLISAVAT
jgi:hypothetical protein